MQLQNKVALITGGGRGIGAESARLFAEAGAKLILVSRTKPELDALAKELFDTYDTDTLTMVCDVTKAADVKSMVAEAAAHFGRIDILLNAAGTGQLKPVLELAVEEFDAMIDLNLKGTFYVSKAVCEVMVKQKSGLVINLPGILGKHAMLMSSGYSASKFGVTGLTKAMALDLRREGVKFTLLHLGGVNTSFWDNVSMKVQRDKMLTARDAAQAVLQAALAPQSAVLSEITLQPENHQML
ncbi:MAG: SDR family oxidoreductase [Rhizobacter sp.]|nr:SDR family oxidoreductase [Chlorobiales bacterium]